MKRIKPVIVLLTLLLSSCGQGPKGDPGQDGAPGQQGPAGLQGAQGNAGVDATPVTLVQFCKGMTHYPDTFCEVGFCIGGNLYATYSANGGFSSEILPGSWESKGINCSCIFTVTTNCGVVQ